MHALIILLIISTMIFLVALLTIMFLKLFKKRKKSTIEEKIENTILRYKTLSKMLKEKGIDTEKSDKILLEMEHRFEKGDIETALVLGTVALNQLEDLKTKQQETYLTLKKDRTADILAGVDIFNHKDKNLSPEEEVSDSYRLRQRLPQNYIEAKFEISVTRSMIEFQTNPNIDIASAKNYLKSAEEAFHAKDYKKALSYALRAQRIAKGRDVNFSVESLEVSESVRSKHSCGAEINIGDTFCRKCGEKLNFCLKCKIVVDSDDVFCRKCGSKLK